MLPYLKSKMEKSFVDHFLVGDHERVSSYAAFEKIHQLNAFEKCLLILVLVTKGQKEKAKEIVEAMKDE